jgi:carboxylesterase type B
LNVYVPSLQSRYVTQTGYSVLVHFPSEEFQVGTANRDIFDGTELAALANNAIVVTVNFRVGVMGFMALNELANEDPTFRSTGNYGLFDQIEALRWVRQNIRSFAGNPANITVSGESACLLMLTEASKIASSFICQSSPLLRAVSFPPTSLAIQYHAKVLDGIQCARTNSLDSLECLRLQASASDIVSYVADNYLGGAYPQPQYNIGPVVDGLLFKNHPALLILSQSVDLRANSIMLGTTRDEMTWRAYAMFPGALSPSDYAAQWPRIEEALTKNYIGTLYPFILSSPEKSSAIKAVYDPIKMKHLCSNNDCRYEFYVCVGGR